MINGLDINNNTDQPRARDNEDTGGRYRSFQSGTEQYWLMARVLSDSQIWPTFCRGKLTENVCVCFWGRSVEKVPLYLYISYSNTLHKSNKKTRFEITRKIHWKNFHI